MSTVEMANRKEELACLGFWHTKFGQIYDKANSPSTQASSDSDARNQMDQNEWTFCPGQPGPYVVKTETQVSRDHVNMLVGSYPRDAPPTDLFF